MYGAGAVLDPLQSDLFLTTSYKLFLAEISNVVMTKSSGRTLVSSSLTFSATFGIGSTASLLEIVCLFGSCDHLGSVYFCLLRLFCWLFLL